MESRNLILKHFFVWIIYISIAIFSYGYKQNDWAAYSYETTISHIVSAGIFYVSAFFVLPRFWVGKKYILAVGLLLAILIFSIFTRFLLYFSIFPFLLNKEVDVTGFTNDQLAVRFFFQWFTFTLYAILYWQAKSKIELQYKLSEEIKSTAKREKLELENEALRAQINPHFIFNTLEPLRTKTANILPEVSQSLGSFMRIIRSGITSPGEDGKIPLEIELDAIEGTIYIYKQRFPDLCLSHVSRIKDEESIRILPHILIPFVENAFKHGVLNDTNNRIKIELNVSQEAIHLQVSNKKNNRMKHQSTGIGLKYIKRHLESGYQSKHKLIINESMEDYEVNLSVQLN